MIFTGTSQLTEQPLLTQSSCHPGKRLHPVYPYIHTSYKWVERYYSIHLISDIGKKDEIFFSEYTLAWLK